MRRSSPKRLPSPAMAVAFIALLAALSGTAIALPGKNTVDSGDIKRGSVKPSDIATNAVGGMKVKDGGLTGADVKAESLTEADVQDGSLTGADVRADALTGGEVAEGTLGKVPSAQAADTAQNATTLQGKGPNDFAPSAREAIRFIGAPGQPPFAAGWGNPGFPGDEEPGFFKDPYGIVHLYGNAGRNSGSDDLIFTLPAGYRPAETLYFAVYAAGPGVSSVAVHPNGDVAIFGADTNFVGLGPVTFPAG